MTVSLTAAGLFLSGVLAPTVLAQSVGGQGQDAALDTLLRAHAHMIRIDRQTFAGPGGQLLISAADSAQFVAIGEEHNTRAIPGFTTILFSLLHQRSGFNYLALEEGPYLGRLLSRAARSGGRDSVMTLGLRHPNAFHMYTVDELWMIGDIGRVSTATTDRVWGLNQEFGAAHVYSRLVELAPNARAKALARELLDQALNYEGERFQKNVHYLVQTARPEDFERLRAAFAPAPGSEADRLISQTSLSNRIYAPYGATPSPPFPVFYEAGQVRETNMKHLFAEQYRQAINHGDSLPKVVVKSGQLHLYRGLSERTEQFTLGNFISELATFNGKHSLHVYVVVDRKYVREGWLAPFVGAARLGEDAVFDLRPLRPVAARNRIRQLDPQLRRLILGYDLFVLLRDDAAGQLDPLRTPKFRWYPEER